MTAEMNRGAPVSRITVRVTVVLFPALSVDTITIVFVPCVSVSALLNVPSALTVTFSAVPLFSLTVTLQGLDVTSFVVPDTVQDALFVTRLSAGLETDNTGATVSTLNVTDFCVAILSSLSLASNLTVWLPSDNAVPGV